jgi:hypothetical protein
MKELYLYPSLELASQQGLQLAVSKGQFYDAAIQHGVFGTDSLAEIIKRTPGTPRNNELEWMTRFLRARQHVLCNPASKQTKDAWCASVTRVHSYQYLLSHNPPDFDTEITALNNDGEPVSVKCNLAVEQYFVPSAPIHI